MDKNTITGLVLIALLLVGFSILSRPSKEQLEAMQHYNDSVALVRQREAELQEKTKAALANEGRGYAAVDSTALFFRSAQGENEVIIIGNELAKVSISTQGGRISSVALSEYMEQDKETPVCLFSGEDAGMNFLFYNSKETIQTKDYYFTPVDISDLGVTMRLLADDESYIDFRYTMTPGSYLVDFAISATGMEGKLAASKTSVDIEWEQRARQIERGYTYENRLSQLTYKLSGKSTKQLSASKDNEKDVEEELDWIAFKNQFFSAVFISDTGFSHSKLSSKMEKEGSGYIKSYAAEMSTAFDPTGQSTTELHFYLGPNHYKTLTGLDKGRSQKWKLNRLVYLGWPLIRWINQFFTINVFAWLQGWGMSMGLVLLFMTLIVKAVVFPATYKTYMSSAKMRVLRPKIEEINQKYPKQEDAMKKQQEQMTLYNQYGVSPMGGCLPMLIQFPVLMALFMFVPSAIELRGESFLWADDLSTYDALIHFPFSIPLLGNHLSLFCLLMSATNVINSYFMMKQQDNGANPQMAAMKWMTYLMPIMFLFILNNYPSGLNYYYFLSTLISVVTMIILRKRTDEAKLLAQLEAKKKDLSKMKKSGFAARLEALQKEQEQMKQQQQRKR